MFTHTPGRDSSAEPGPWPAGIPPASWPIDPLTGKPRRYCFHAMRPDLKDLLWDANAQHVQLHPAGDEVRCLVVHSVAEGSNQTSPFFHASWIIQGAQRYRSMAQTKRGEDEDSQPRIQAPGGHRGHLFGQTVTWPYCAIPKNVESEEQKSQNEHI